jgi:hypothetical protein
MGREEYSVTCTCGITRYAISMEVPQDSSDGPRRMIIRCSRCGRVRFLLDEQDGDLWSVLDRLPP